MKENSPIWARLAEMVSAVPRGWRNASTMASAAIDLPITMMATVASTGPGCAHENRGIEQHADRDEEQHREGVAKRQGLLSRLVAERRFREDHAGEEGAERERHPEQLGRAEGDAERDGEHREPEQLARARMGHVVQHPGDEAPADDQHDADERSHLDEGQRQRDPHAVRVDPADETGRGHRIVGSRGIGTAAEDAGQGRQQNQREDHGEVLDDQPPHRDAPLLALDQAPLLERAQQHDRARHRQGQAEDEARRRATSRATSASAMPSRVALAIWTTAPGIAMARTAKRSLSEKCSPTPNMSRITPISASCGASSWSAT